MRSLDLPVKYEGRVRLCFDVINKLIPAAEIYLFGVYGGNIMNETSKVGILVLVGSDNSFRELRKLRWEVEEMIYAINDELFEIDLRIFPKAFYVKYVNERMKLKETKVYQQSLNEVIWR